MTVQRTILIVSLVLAGWQLGCAVNRGGPVTTSPEPGPAPGAPLDAAAVLPLDPAVRHGRLPNGLTYYVRANRKPENRAELWLALNAGSLQEDDDQRGLAHFVEHMAFNGTRNFAKQELIDFLELTGMRFGPDINAYTSFDETVYMLMVPTDAPETLERAFVVLEDWAHGVTFEDEEIDKERGVVLEEWRSGRGAGARIRDQQFPVLFRGSRYAERLTIGDPEIIRHAPHDALRRFYRDWYRPDLMALIAVGDFDPAEIERRIRGRFAGLRGPESPRERVEYAVPDHDETLVKIATDPEQTRTTVSVYYKLAKRPQGTAADYRRGLVEQVYRSMLNARLDELRQQAAPPFLYAFSSAGSLVRTRDVYSQGAGVEAGGLARGLEALLTEAQRVDRHGFTAGELERTTQELLRFFDRAYAERDKQESGRLASEILRHFLTDEPMPGIAAERELAGRFLPGITLAEVNGLAREWISERNRVILVSAPEQQDVTLPDESELLAVFQAAERKPVEPYRDLTRDEPLVAEPPQPGTIVARSSIPEIGVTVWELSNGVRVVLKPTTFKNDEIVLTGFGPGGHSLASDELYESASRASAVARAGGLGRFNRIELEKALAGKVAGAGSFIGELEQGVSGGASPQDVETMFQLVWLSITAPRRDAEAFSAWIARSKGWIENRLARPETAFSDRLTQAVYGDHPRRQPGTVEQLDEVDLDAALAFYRERFASVRDYTFVIVGNFDEASLEPLVTTWIGGLPAASPSAGWRDVGAERAPGIVEVTVRKGLEPKSQVRLWFHGGAAWTRQADHDLDSLAAALRIRLRELLREDMGGTYGVGVGGSIARRPREEYSLSVSFGCAPENVESLIAAVWEEVGRAKREGFDQEVLDKVKQAQRRSRETNLERNGFWRGMLAQHYRYGTDPRLILAHDELVESVTAERLRKAARRYLDDRRHVLGVLLPEEAESGE